MSFDRYFWPDFWPDIRPPERRRVSFVCDSCGAAAYVQGEDLLLPATAPHFILAEDLCPNCCITLGFTEI